MGKKTCTKSADNPTPRAEKMPNWVKRGIPVATQADDNKDALKILPHNPFRDEDETEKMVTLWSQGGDRVSVALSEPCGLQEAFDLKRILSYLFIRYNQKKEK